MTRTIREAPLGIAEIAHLLEVKPGTVAQWRQRHIFPHPELTVNRLPAWWADTIIEWAEATGRR